MNREMLKGTTEVMVLKLLAQGPMYGYGLIKKFDLLSNGTFQFKEGTLYPILHALEKKGYIKSYWAVGDGRKRKYYDITEDGLAQLQVKTQEWVSFSRALNGILEF
jgi:DNA-binding PadR family transcriptional regulator